MPAIITDHYTVLGVERSADRTSIRRAYRIRAREAHPDFGGDEQAMARVNEAWRVLGDPERRAAYDGSVGAAPARSLAPKDASPVLDFGRYQGWSLGDVANVDDDYLEWLMRTPAGRHLQADIKHVLSRRAQAMEGLRPAAARQERGGRLWRRR